MRTFRITRWSPKSQTLTTEVSGLSEETAMEHLKDLRIYDQTKLPENRCDFAIVDEQQEKIWRFVPVALTDRTEVCAVYGTLNDDGTIEASRTITLETYRSSQNKLAANIANAWQAKSAFYIKRRYRDREIHLLTSEVGPHEYEAFVVFVGRDPKYTRLNSCRGTSPEKAISNAKMEIDRLY